MAVAMKVAAGLREDQTCVVLCPDNIRNYMTKFVVDNWLEARNFKDSINVHCHPWWNRKVSELIEGMETTQLTMLGSTTCREVINSLKAGHVDQIPVVDSNGQLLGVATISFLMNKLLDSSLNPSDPIEKALFKKFVRVGTDITAGRLSRILEKEAYVVVADKENLRKPSFPRLFPLLNFAPTDSAADESKENGSVRRAVFVITQKDLLKFLPLSTKH